MHRFAFALLASSCLIAPMASAQLPIPRDAPDPVAALGQYLFESPLLSEGATVSCATCHAAAKGFSDGLPEAKGVLGAPVGRNAATLWSAGRTATFPGLVPSAPDVSNRSGRFRGFGPSFDVVALTLEERCLAPIANPLEMGDTVDAVVQTLNANGDVKRQFDLVFGAPTDGATAQRLGKALGAYVRTLDAPDTAYRRYLRGDLEALALPAKYGREVFLGKGRCDSCHSGEGLTDGRMHFVRTPTMQFERLRKDPAKRQERIARVREASTALANARAKKAGGAKLEVSVPDAGYYGDGGSAGLVQTLTLWDVSRTAPYFRDGSVDDLDAALRVHIAELRGLDRDEEQAASRGRTVGVALPDPELPEPLKPVASASPAVPEELVDQEVEQLLAFLRAL